MKTNTLMPVIKAILNDEEFLCGGMQIMLKRNASSATAELLFHF